MSPDVAVVIPHFQRERGILSRAVRSAMSQTVADRVVVIVADDGSPSDAASELADAGWSADRLKVLRRPNGGAGAARNSALDAVPAGVRYVAFLDSDDAWRERHLEIALRGLAHGYDAWFSNFIAVGYPDIGHFERIGSLLPDQNPVVDAEARIHALACTALEHTVSDGGGLIGTPTVVYDYAKYPRLRFREEFYNGQDFFFWMDLSELGARWAYGYEITCDCGTGVNIYQGSGWGSDKSLQRLRNELFVWTSVERFYRLPPALAQANQRTIRHLQNAVAADLLYRMRRGKPIDRTLLADIRRMSPTSLWRIPMHMCASVAAKILRRQ